MPWTLSINDTTKTLADWGLAGCEVDLKSLAASTFSCQSAASTPTSAPLISHGAVVTLYSPDNVCVFRGTSHNPKQTIKGGEVRWVYTCHDVWYDLARTMAQQPWVTWDPIKSADLTRNLARLTFGFNSAGTNLVSTEQMVQDLLTYASTYCGIAISSAISLTYTDSTLGTGQLYPVPWDAVDLTIAAALTQVLKWHPTAMSWFDYSAAPVLHISTSAATSTSQTITGFESLSLSPLYDAQIPGYIVRFETTATKASDNTEHTVIAEMSWPGGIAATTPGVVVTTVDWSGQTIAPPEFIARALYNETATLQMSGSIILHGTDCDVRPWFGRVAIDGFPLAGDAVVTGVKYSIDARTTTLTIGPTGKMGASTMLDILGRSKAKTTTLGSQTDSSYSSTSPAGPKDKPADLSDQDRAALDKIPELETQLDSLNGTWTDVRVSTDSGPQTRKFFIQS